MLKRPSPALQQIALWCLACSPTLVPAFGSAQMRRALPTHVAAPASEPAAAPAPTEQPIRFTMTLPLRNRAGLEALVKAQRDPSSPSYRRFLSRDEFVAQFGPTQADYDRVVAFAQTQGFTVERTLPTRMALQVASTPAGIDKAFAVRMQMHQRAGQPGMYYAPNVEPTVSASVPILSVEGLSNRDLPRPMLKHENGVHANTTGSGAGGTFLGSDMRAAYAGTGAPAGTGQAVGLIELGPYNLSDVTAYFNAVHQPLSVPIFNSLLGVDGVCSTGCDDGEEVIDMQQAISMAPGLSALIIYEAYGGTDALLAFAQAASDNIARQLSLSFGFGGTPATQPGYEQVFLELQAQGQNLFIASGDSGAFPGTGGYPGNSPNVTDVGGTDLVTAGPGGPWQSESAWIGSGGGWNTESPIPHYQVGAVNSANGSSSQYRNVPDVAMEADTDNFFCANGGCAQGIGGTSLAAPRWAAFLALANEQANGVPVGFLNTTVYALGQTKAYADAFHDITVGNNFNAGSPNLFQAVPGYDLTSGWGTPNGSAALDTLGAAPAAGAPNFALTASRTNFPLRPGDSATATLSLLSRNGFAAPVDLRVVLVGAPAGVTATLSRSTLSGNEEATVSIRTTSQTPGGSYLVAVTGTGGGLSHTAYITLTLPDFSITASPTTVYLNQQGSAADTLSVNAINGFDASVAFALGQLPPGLRGTLAPQTSAAGSTLTLSASTLAPTTSGHALSVTGQAGSTVRTVPALSVAVSAAAGECGLGDFVDLQPYFNLVAAHSDGKLFTDGGLDGTGHALSATQLGPSRVLNGIRYRFGSPDVPNGVYAAGQTIALPVGRYNVLQLVGAAINGSQNAQPITVTYTDGSTAQFSQGFSDWFSPSTNPAEGEAVATPYRVLASGVNDARQFNVYSYSLPLDPTRLVRSVTLPKNRNVVVLAATLSFQNLGTEINLAKAYNATGIYSDGASFDPAGGLDAGGAAYSANLLGDTAPGGREVLVGYARFHLAGGNVPNVVYGAGQTITLAGGFYTSLQLLGTGVQGYQLSQPIVIHYEDGTSDTVQQSFSDWSTLGGYANESLAISTAYRDYSDGSQDQQAFNVYLYTLPLRPLHPVKSITLPDNRNLVLLSATLVPWTILTLEPEVCRSPGGPPAPLPSGQGTR